MRRRRYPGAIAAVLAVALLSGCTVAISGAVRLNRDGTIDYFVCERTPRDVYVDYEFDGEVATHDDMETAEWTASSSEGSPDPGVVEYGVLPAGFTEEAPVEPPPVEWYGVFTQAGYVDRDELTVGEWYWTTGNFWPWIPDGHKPCAGYEIGPDGDPRETP